MSAALPVVLYKILEYIYKNFKTHFQTADQEANEYSQNPIMDNQPRVPPQITAANMQNNNKGNMNTSYQAVPSQNVMPKFSCKDCSFTCGSFQNFRIHLQSAHNKKDEDIQKMSPLKIAEIQKEKEPPTIQPGTVHGSSGRNIATLKDYISRADREPLIGLEYVLEYRFQAKGNQIETRYFCELCECDTDVDSMIEHLAGFGHRKLYLAKEYAYVLKAQANSKEDKSLFIRRMALEIEREEGTKIYMTDQSIWMETMMALRTAEKKMKKRTRWDNGKNDETRMKKALNFLGTFEIESEIEATNVARLCEKLTSNLKLYNNQTKADALFPARVARAQDVAMSLMKNAARQRKHLQIPAQKKGKHKMPPQHIQRPPTLPGNVNFKNNPGMPSRFPGPRFQNVNMKQNMPVAPPHRQEQNYPFVPFNETEARGIPTMPKITPTMPKMTPTMPKMTGTSQTAQPSQSDDGVIKNISQEDTHFFKKLMTLLEVIPQNSTSEATQMNSKLLMLKSLLVNQKNTEHEQENQKLMTQIASMVQDKISAQSASLNQQLMMLMTSQNSTAMVMQTSSLGNNPMAAGSFIPGIQSLGSMQTNVNSLMPFNQSFGSQTYGQMAGNDQRPMDRNAYQVPQAEMGNYPSTSQNYDNTGYGNSMVGNYLPEGNPYAGQHDGAINSLTTRHNEQKPKPYTMGYDSSAGDKDNSYYGNSSAPEPRYADEKALYTRVSLSPRSPRNQYDFDDMRGEMKTQDSRQRPNLRAYQSDWDDQEGDMQYNKRPRLDVDNRSSELESYHNQSHEPLGLNTEGMPEELRKRIQGKDLFTASAIIGEYSERRSGK